jgi:large subunit ribosomal protein L30
MTKTTTKPATAKTSKAATKTTKAATTNKPASKAVKVAKTGKTLKVTQIKSLIGTKQSHRDTIRGLGLRRINHTVQLEDTPCVRGMINKVFYMVKCEA